MRTSIYILFLTGSISLLSPFPTRYQALYKDVQRLIEDTAPIAVRNKPLLYMYAPPHTAVTGYGGNTKIITPLFHKNISGLYSTLSNHPIFQAVCGMQTNSFPYPILS